MPNSTKLQRLWLKCIAVKSDSCWWCVGISSSLTDPRYCISPFQAEKALRELFCITFKKAQIIHCIIFLFALSHFFENSFGRFQKWSLSRNSTVYYQHDFTPIWEIPAFTVWNVGSTGYQDPIVLQWLLGIMECCFQSNRTPLLPRTWIKLLTRGTSFFRFLSKSRAFTKFP